MTYRGRNMEVARARIRHANYHKPIGSLASKPWMNDLRYLALPFHIIADIQQLDLDSTHLFQLYGVLALQNLAAGDLGDLGPGNDGVIEYFIILLQLRLRGISTLNVFTLQLYCISEGNIVSCPTVDPLNFEQAKNFKLTAKRYSSLVIKLARTI